MRKIYLFVTALLISFLIFSCGQKSKNETEITISFWHSFVPSTQPALKEMMAKFEKENPGIKINAQYVPTGDALVQKLISSIQSKTLPDLAWIHSDFIDKLVAGGAVYEMDYFIKGANGLTDEEMNDFFPELLKSAKWKNILYALPMEATVLALHYNKTIFKKAGLDPNHPPRNWNELFDYSKKLTIDKNGDGKIDQYGFYIPVFPASGQLSIWMVLQWEPFVWQAGGMLINEEQTEVLFNKEAGVHALSFWKKTFDMMDFSKFTLSHDIAFSSGTLAMVMDGPWNLPLYRKIKNFEWGIAPLPEGPKSKATYLAGEHLAVFKQSEYPDEAWKFIKWFVQPDNQALFSMKSGYLPVRKSALKLKSYKDFLNADPNMKSFVDQLAIGRARSSIDNYRVEINQSIAEAVEKTIL
ncbi:MAG: ABC transporter substrate-binding protein, partial [Bacteroidota bacterium]